VKTVMNFCNPFNQLSDYQLLKRDTATQRQLIGNHTDLPHGFVNNCY
jgi:hypothetical protein